MRKESNLCFFSCFFCVWSKVFLKLVLLQQWSPPPNHHHHPSSTLLVPFCGLARRVAQEGKGWWGRTDTQLRLNILMSLVWTLKCEDNCNSRFAVFIYLIFLLLCEKKKKKSTHIPCHTFGGLTIPTQASLLHWARMEIAEMHYISVITCPPVSPVHLSPGYSDSAAQCHSRISHVPPHDKSWPAAAATCYALAFLCLSFFHAPLGLVASNIQERQMKCSL